MENVINQGIQVLIPPDAAKRRGARPGWNGGYYATCAASSPPSYGGGLYKRRQAMIEPSSPTPSSTARSTGSATRQIRRQVGVAMPTATHNLLKLHKHQIATSGA